MIICIVSNINTNKLLIIIIIIIIHIIVYIFLNSKLSSALLRVSVATYYYKIQAIF